MAILPTPYTDDLHIMGNYSGHTAFATDLPFCMAYPLSFVHMDDPTR